jgi:hypothetical protein
LTVIPSEYIDLLEGGVSIFVGTRDEKNEPEAVRVAGAEVSKNRTEVTVYIHEEWGAKTLENLRANGEIAAGFSRPMDHLSLQVKGKVKRIVPSSEASRAVPDRYHACYAEQLYIIGMPRSITRRIRVWPAAAVTFEVASIFLQTPGPGAGKKIEAS